MKGGPAGKRAGKVPRKVHLANAKKTSGAEWNKVLTPFHLSEFNGGALGTGVQLLADVVQWFPWRFANCAAIDGFTEHFFYGWMRSRAAPWGTQADREQGRFMMPEGVRNHKCPRMGPILRRVLSKVSKLLNAPSQDGGRRQRLHADVDREVGLGELEDNLKKAKKGTAPGVSGLPVEVWLPGNQSDKCGVEST